MPKNLPLHPPFEYFLTNISQNRFSPEEKKIQEVHGINWSVISLNLYRFLPLAHFKNLYKSWKVGVSFLVTLQMINMLTIVITRSDASP